MSTYTHALTETERSCGVTLTAVAKLLPRGLFIADGNKFVLPAGTPPALALSTARCAFAGAAEYVGHNALGQPVYRRAHGPSGPDGSTP